MPTYKDIRTLARSLVGQVTESGESWKAFLDSAAYTYNYAFPNQLLIFSQRPGATAVASIDYWNNKALRWVNRGSHGIALLDSHSNRGKLRYVFDIADTHGREYVPQAMPWTVDNTNRQRVWEALKQTTDADTVQNAIALRAATQAAEHRTQISRLLENTISGSTLEWRHREDQQKMLEKLVAQSAAYMMAKRCGIDTTMLETDAFATVSEFDTDAIAVALGSLTSQVSRPMLHIFDTVRDPDGTERRVLNPQETQAAQGKQQQIEDAFKEWIWKDQNRRQALVKFYNEKFNSTRPREYDGSHIQFHGMNPEITLRPHQRNAIAHILYGHNTLLGHVVGAGKTYEMVAAAMEKKRLGLCSKTLICVPNHLTEQMASEALQLYPNANILVAKRTDFEKANRKRFCGRIATGNYDIIVIGHSQFERIPLSNERQALYLQKQIDEVIEQTAMLKREHAENFTVKQMERTRKQLEKRLEKLNNTERKDDVVTFEELGVDSLMVDEAHMFKNLMCVSKMRNVAGISQTESQRASDLLMKTMYLDEITGGRGVTFATGTPLSNSMTELYTMQRYLQRHTLEVNGLANFDAWASTFGETVTAIELAPEGTGYRVKTRFAKFYNLPELMAMFKECADIQTADMLKLPVPELEGGKPINVQLQPSSIQRVMVADLGKRADIVRNGSVDPKEDNMLRITNDGRKLALDQRLIDPDLPDDPNSKVNACVDRVFEIWERTKANRSTQLIFCDLSTPKAGVFNVYDDIRDKLVTRGIPKEEIQFIHDANTEARKADLFAKVRSGTVRVLMGSTAKMGAGTNVQRKLIALHHLDVPWRPSDIEQREGRMVRQGNENKEVAIYRYVTEATFDAYSWQLIENKQRFIGQVMTSKSPARSCDDMDEAALSYAEVKALAAGNPAIKEKMDLDIQVTRLRTLKAQYTSQHYRLEDDVAIKFPTEIQKTKGVIANCSADANTVEQNTHLDSEGKDAFSICLMDTTYDKREDAGRALLGLIGAAMSSEKPVPIGSYKGLTVQAIFLPLGQEFHALLVGAGVYDVPLGADASGNITRITNAAAGITKRRDEATNKLAQWEKQLQNAKDELQQPFQQEQELAEKSRRLAELDALLKMDEKDRVVDAVPDEESQVSVRSVRQRCGIER